MRLGFSVAAHIQADVLLLDEVFAVGDEEFQRKCFGKIHEFKSRGGTIVFVSHDAQAVERLCDRAVLLQAGRGRVRRLDARGDRAVPAAARRRAQPRRARGRAARVGERRGAHRLGAAPRRRRRRARGQFAVRRAARRSSSSSPPTPSVAPPRVSLELRDNDGVVLGGVVQPTAELGWGARRRRARSCGSRSTACRSPRGSFHLRCALVDGDGGGCCTCSTTRLASSSSRPAPRPAPVLLEGRWSVQEIAASAPIADSR